MSFKADNSCFLPTMSAMNDTVISIHGVRCLSNFAFQMAALMPPWIADRHAC
jgi:hypothetical protein